MNDHKLALAVFIQSGFEDLNRWTLFLLTAER